MVLCGVWMEGDFSRRAFAKFSLLEHPREGGTAFHVDRLVVYLSEFPVETP
jgi:hypothetical protein